MGIEGNFQRSSALKTQADLLFLGGDQAQSGKRPEVHDFSPARTSERAKTTFELDGVTPAFVEEFRPDGSRRSLTTYHDGRKNETSYYVPAPGGNERLMRSVKYHDDSGNGIMSDTTYIYTGATETGWDSKDYRPDGSLSGLTSWRAAVKDESGAVLLPNYFASTNYEPNGRVKKESITSGDHTTTTEYEADGKTAKRVERFERSGESPFAGTMTIEEFSGGIRRARTVEDHERNGHVNEVLHEDFDANGQLNFRRYPHHDETIGRDVTRVEHYTAGNLSSWVEQMTNEHGYSFITRQFAVDQNGSGTEVRYSLAKPSTSWWPWAGPTKLESNERVPDNAVSVPQLKIRYVGDSNSIRQIK